MQPTESRSNWKFTLLIGMAAILISMVRRPNQINYPEVWVEEGTQFIPQFLEHGWLFLFEPVNGYLIIPSKLIALISYYISFVHYPAVSYTLTLLVSGLVAITIYRSPTFLRYPSIAALVPFLIPFDPEPIGIGEYAFWFVGLFSVLALVWQAEKATKLRLVLTGVGGLSAPLGVSLLPLFVLRALLTRHKSDLLTLVVALFVTAIQMWFVFSTGSSSANFLSALLSDPYENLMVFITKFIGKFFWARDPSTLLAIAAIFVGCMYVWRDLHEQRYVALTFLICAAISAGLSIIRVPLDAIDPMQGGPRYFFYPYIFISWALLSFCAVRERRKAILIAGLLVFINTLSFISRPHDDLDWAGAVEDCLQSANGADLPVHFTGDSTIAWKVSLTQAECERMERLSIF